MDNRGGRVARFDGAGEWAGDLGRRGQGPGEPEVGARWLDDNRIMAVNPPIFSVRPPWAMAQGRVVWVRPESAELHVLDLASGRLERLVRLDRAVGPPTWADKEATADARAERFGLDPARRAALLAEATWADVRPPIAALLLDDEDRIWVDHHDPRQFLRSHAGSAFDVLDADGRPLFHVAFPADFLLKTVRAGRAYGVTSTDADVHVIDIYDVR